MVTPLSPHLMIVQYKSGPSLKTGPHCKGELYLSIGLTIKDLLKNIVIVVVLLLSFYEGQFVQ